MPPTDKALAVMTPEHLRQIRYVADEWRSVTEYHDVAEVVRYLVAHPERLAGEDEVVVKRKEIEATANILERAGRPDVARVVRDW